MSEIPFGFCQCGCGRRTNIANHSDRRKNIKKGEPRPFLKGHWQRVYAKPRKPIEYEVDPDTGCWNWLKYKGKDGYGRTKPRDGGSSLAHRNYYERAKGPIPEGLQVDHLCRNRSCVNPDHLEAVTPQENVLRGEGIAARWARRTHCERGHELSGDNLQFGAKGARRCRACRQLWEGKEAA